MHKNEELFKLGILIPCLNEEKNIQELYKQLTLTLIGIDYSIIFIDDGSTDNTVPLIKKLSSEGADIRYIILSRNFGHQNALKAGYDFCTDFDCVVCMDADCQHPASLIPEMLKEWKNGFDIVNTVRTKFKTDSQIKAFLSRGFYKVINFISKGAVIPNSPDFRLMDKKVVSVISTFNESSFFIREIVPWVGFKQTTLSFIVGERFEGESKYTLRKQLSFSFKGIVSASINPLRLSILLGFIFGSLSFLYGFYAIYIYVFTDKAITGWTSLMASVLFIAGIQCFLLGIIGEYLGKTFLETRKRPLYLVDESNLKALKNEKKINHDNLH